MYGSWGENTIGINSRNILEVNGDISQRDIPCTYSERKSETDLSEESQSAGTRWSENTARGRQQKEGDSAKQRRRKGGTEVSADKANTAQIKHSDPFARNHILHSNLPCVKAAKSNLNGLPTNSNGQKNRTCSIF